MNSPKDWMTWKNFKKFGVVISSSGEENVLLPQKAYPKIDPKILVIIQLDNVMMMSSISWLKGGVFLKYGLNIVSVSYFSARIYNKTPIFSLKTGVYEMYYRLSYTKFCFCWNLKIARTLFGWIGLRSSDLFLSWGFLWWFKKVS